MALDFRGIMAVNGVQYVQSACHTLRHDVSVNHTLHAFQNFPHPGQYAVDSCNTVDKKCTT